MQQGASHAEPWRGYTYDGRGALTRVWEDESVDHSTLVAQNNSLDNPKIDAFAGGLTTAIAWDYEREPNVGSLVSISEPTSGVDRWRTLDSSGSTTMQRDDGHRLDLVEVDSASYQIDHDDSGAVTDAFEFSMTYGPTGRLVQVDDTGGMLEAYAYDARGQLAAVFDGAGLRETFVYDGPQIIASYDAAEQPRWEAVWGAKLDQLLAFHDFGTGRSYLPLTDHRNSIVGTWSTDDRKIDAVAEYSPHGRMKLYNADESPDCPARGASEEYCLDPTKTPSGLPFGFVSAWQSPATGLVYMRNRWYSPRLTQFLTHDPLGYIDSYNPYAYVGFDPINGWDPWGLQEMGHVTMLEPGQPASSYPERVQMPLLVWGKLRALADDDHVPSSLSRHSSQPTMERAAIVTRLGKVFALSKEEHAVLTQGDIHGHSPNAEKVLRYLDENREDFDAEDAAIYVHTHPDGSPPSPQDVAINALPDRAPLTTLVVGDDMYLIVPTEETERLQDSLVGERDLYERTRRANIEGRNAEAKTPQSRQLSQKAMDRYFDRIAEAGLVRGADASRQIVRKLDTETSPLEFRPLPKKSFAH